MREPVRCKQTGLWLARYKTADGKVRQAGRFKHKSEARRAIRLASGRPADEPADSTLADFFALWPQRFPRAPRTEQTNLHRIRRYILPYLPSEGRISLRSLRRSMLRDVQAELLSQGLSKRTIDHAFASLSTMLNDAAEDELIEANPARGFRVRASDPRLAPSRSGRVRRAVPIDEIHTFMAAVPRRYRAVCWAPVLTGARPGELFAMRREDMDRPLEMIYLHQTADRYGRIAGGLKSTHHVPPKEARGRWTLFPRPLIELCDELPSALSGWLFTSPRGKVWAQRNFYRDVWDPAREASGTDFTLYDLRHTFSSRLIGASIPLPEVAAWMGHSLRAGGMTVNTTATTYAHPTGEHRHQALEELYRVIGSLAIPVEHDPAGPEAA
jgi:integrase